MSPSIFGDDDDDDVGGDGTADSVFLGGYTFLCN